MCLSILRLQTRGSLPLTKAKIAQVRWVISFTIQYIEAICLQAENMLKMQDLDLRLAYVDTRHSGTQQLT